MSHPLSWWHSPGVLTLQRFCFPTQERLSYMFTRSIYEHNCIEKSNPDISMPVNSWVSLRSTWSWVFVFYSLLFCLLWKFFCIPKMVYILYRMLLLLTSLMIYIALFLRLLHVLTSTFLIPLFIWLANLRLLCSCSSLKTEKAKGKSSIPVSLGCVLSRVWVISYGVIHKLVVVVSLFHIGTG